MEKWNWSEISTNKKIITVAVATAVAVVGTWVCFFGPLSSKGLEQDLAELKSDNERITSDFCSTVAGRRTEVCESAKYSTAREPSSARVTENTTPSTEAELLVAAWIPEHCTAAVVDQGVSLEQLNSRQGSGSTWFVDAARNLHWIVNTDQDTVTLAKWFSPTDYRAVVAAEECVQ